MTTRPLTSVAIDPEGLLDAAETIQLGDICTCDWLSRWVPAPTFLQWAQLGLAAADKRGLSDAICYAKRAVTCRIDTLLSYNHLIPLSRSRYPQKIAALRQIGLLVPDVVHSLVIEPRNELEHLYRWPDDQTARSAVDIAGLFLGSTDVECNRASIVAVGWNVNGSHSISPKGEFVSFIGFKPAPMLFIDVFEDCPTAKIVDPRGGEIRAVELEKFSESQAMRLAMILRKNYSARSRSQHGSGPSYFKEMKRQGGF